jgi:N-acetyl-anhydromuramyl-L-alanine amidase AmpD
MSTRIRPNRLEVSDRFPMLGFTVRTDGNAKRYEIAIGTSPDLFGPDGKNRRSRSNFYSTRAAGPLPIERGEAVYVLPSEVLARFVGQAKLYYGLATVGNGNGSGGTEVATIPGSGSPYISLSGLSGRSLQRVRLLPNRQRLASNYGKSGSELEWAGDTLTPGTQPAIPPAAKNGTATNEPSAAAPTHYDDGYGPLPPAPPAAPKQDQTAQAKSLADDVSSGEEDAQHGIAGPVPDSYSAALGLSRPLAISPEYPSASRFEPANSKNFRAVSGTRTINRIVIHITDGGGKLNGTVSWFKDPSARVSAHYIVGQDGEVVQMVKHNDVAWHASSANGDSIGIEHEARSPHEWDRKLGHTDPGLMPTDQQYCASAALVSWLCNEFNLPLDRTHILGHSEADPKNPHPDCPNGVWDWDYYMGLVTSGTCTPRTVAASSLASDQSFDENWNDVEVMGQPENYSCWATAASMVVGWRDKVSLDIQALKKWFTGNTGVSSDSGLYAHDNQKLADTLGLVAEPPQSYSVDGFRRLLENYGPLWVGIHTEDGWGHAVAVSGLYGDGTPDNTYVRIHDPWGRVPGTPGKPGYHNPTPGQGSRYTLTFSEFGKEYEAFASSTDGNVNVQILHAADTGGRTIGTGADQTYALAAADATLPAVSPTNAQKGKGEEWHSGKHKHKHHHHHDSPTSAASLADDDANLQPVQLPPAELLSGWKKLVVRGAVDALVTTASGPVGTVFPMLIRMANEQGFSIGVGLGGDAGLLGGAGLGFGLILAPNDNVGIFGSVEVNVGLLAGISAGAKVIMVRGGIEAFNGTSYALGVTVEEGPSISAIALFNSQKEFHGVSFQLGVGVALSPIQIFTGVEKSVSKAVTQSLAASGSVPSWRRSAISVPMQEEAATQPASTTSGFGVSDDARRTLKCIQQETEQGRPISFIVRYLMREMSLAETTALSDAGLPIVSCYELNAGDPDIKAYTRKKGKEDGKRAFAKAQAVGQPAGTPIYFAIDTDPGQQRQVILDYFEGVKEGCAQFLADLAAKGLPSVVYDIGVYGGRCALEWCKDQGIATWFWQAFAPAWCSNSNGQVWPGANIHTWTRDSATPLPCGRETFDRLEGWGNEGGWTVAAADQSQALSVRLPAPPPKRSYVRGQAVDSQPRMIANSAVNTVTGAEGNITWELDQFPGMKMGAQSAVAPLQSAETIQLSNWPYCDHAGGGRSAAWFTVDWKFSGQALGQVRISSTGTQQGPQPLRVEARIEDGKNRDASTVSLAVRFTYHFSTTEGPEVVALTDLVLYSDGSIDQRSNWTSQAAA